MPIVELPPNPGGSTTVAPLFAPRNDAGGCFPDSYHWPPLITTTTTPTLDPLGRLRRALEELNAAIAEATERGIEVEAELRERQWASGDGLPPAQWRAPEVKVRVQAEL
jgi:hypothetical protein